MAYWAGGPSAAGRGPGGFVGSSEPGLLLLVKKRDD